MTPDYAEAHVNRGFVLKELLRLDEALASYNRAIELRPDFAEAHFNKSTALLLSGQFEPGWREYEWRFRIAGAAPLMPPTTKPQWDGSALPDRRLLLIAAAILILGLLRADWHNLFPPGWWRW